TEKEFDSVEFEATATKETQAIIQWNYFEPHWHAYIDDKEVPIQKVWPELMSITIPAGTHEVEVEYTTNTTHLLAWFITFLTAALMIYYVRK
ncbi:MAG TPA: YfhO family protein, partial [Candidatus Nanoarchaeia archaeon]|nr:YfhO family protein [Candidatus Nanoarchaeia archaeon]